jgi:hypothetical protein
MQLESRLLRAAFLCSLTHTFPKALVVESWALPPMDRRIVTNLSEGQASVLPTTYRQIPETMTKNVEKEPSRWNNPETQAFPTAILILEPRLSVRTPLVIARQQEMRSAAMK